MRVRSHPSWVCGLKRLYRKRERFGGTSHPSWVCGLKLDIEVIVEADITSHPSWVCGLKPILWYDDIRKYMVTPFVGVWIETKS